MTTTPFDTDMEMHIRLDESLPELDQFGQTFVRMAYELMAEADLNDQQAKEAAFQFLVHYMADCGSSFDQMKEFCDARFAKLVTPQPGETP